MCGIAGIFCFSNVRVQPGLIRSMTDAMQHRGPDAEGFYAEGPIALGHRRLSIIDLSEVSNQPFSNASGRYVMVFNGEIFNFESVRAQMTGTSFRSSGDTEVLIESIARWGLDALSKIKGMFAFAVWDKQEETLLLVRDRLGVKPLYYHLDNDVLVFSSEIRSILASGLVERKLNKAALTGFLKYQSVCGPQTLVSGIMELPAGSYMKVSAKGIDIVRYWEITNRGKFEGDISEVRKNIYNLFSEAVRQRMISDVPLGAFLSGGIDSSAVVGMMARVSKIKPVTFSIGFDETKYDESEYASMVAKRFGTDHHSIVMKPRVMLDELDEALSSMDSPTGDGVNTYVVSKAVRKAGLTVALSGVGGDELFAGYPFFKRYARLRRFEKGWELGQPLRRISSLFIKDDKWRDLLRVESLGISQVYPVLRQVLSKRMISSCLNAADATDPVADILRGHIASIEQFPYLSQVSIAEYLAYTRQTLLRDTDQMSMAVSLEVREPFFDHELVEYVLSVPDKIKYPHTPKKLLVDSLGDLLPPEIVHRHKQGFTFPWAAWLKGDLRMFCDGNIESICERDFINKDGLKRLWAAFLQDDPSVKWQQIWLFVILEYWLNKNEIK